MGRSYKGITRFLFLAGMLATVAVFAAAAGANTEVKDEKFTKQASGDVTCSSAVSTGGGTVNVSGTWPSSRLWINLVGASGSLELADAPTKAVAIAAVQVFQVDGDGKGARLVEQTRFAKGITIIVTSSRKDMGGLVFSVPDTKGGQPSVLALTGKLGKFAEQGYEGEVVRFDSSLIEVIFTAWPPGDPRIYQF